MIEFRVKLPNEPGQLARLGLELGLRGINLHAVASVGGDNMAVFAIVTDNEPQTREVLASLDLSFEEIDLLQIKILDHAGELGRIAQQLGDAGINIDSVYICDKTTNEVEVAFTVSHPTQAKELLKL